MAPILDLLLENSSSEETQQARLNAAKGKNILWVILSYSSWLGVVGTAGEIHSLGLNKFMVFPDIDAGHALAEKCREAGYLAGGMALFADMTDEDLAVENVLHAAVATGVQFDGVFSPYEHSQTMVGELCERLGLTGNTKTSYVAARNKLLSRDICRAAGIATPAAIRVQTRTELPTVATTLGFPVVVKPQSGAGSDGVYKCSDLGELYAAFDRSEKAVHENALLKWNPGCQEGILVESYIDGDEFDVDLLFWDGECVYGNANDNWPTMEPTFLETGSNSPSTYTTLQQRELVDYAVQCVKALGFTQGCFHVECKYTKHTMLRDNGEGQPMLIEINPRLGGGRTNLLHKEVYGVNLQLEFVLSACGIPINPPRALHPLCAVADYCFCAPKTGFLAHTRYLDHIQAHPDVIYTLVTKSAGDQVKGYDTGIPEWVAFIAVKKESLGEAVDLLKVLVASIAVPVVNVLEEVEKGPVVEAVVPMLPCAV